MLALLLALLTTMLMALSLFARQHRGAGRHAGSWRDTAALSLLGLLTVGFFWRLLSGDAYAPAGGGDLASFLYPYYRYACACLRAGVFPGWNPYVWSGMPFIGDIQNGALYPVNLLQFLLSSGVTYPDMQALAVLHVFVAGCGTYVCLRFMPDLRLSRGPAFLGAIAFMYSDLFIVHFGNLNLIAVVAWLPLLLLVYSLSIHRGSYLLAGWAGALLGISALAGHIQPTVYNGLALAAYTGWMAWRSARTGVPLRISLKPFGQLAAAAVVAFVLSAPATLPAIALTGETARAEFTYWQASAYSLTPLRALGLVVPDLFGRDPALYWGVGDRVESGYLGLLPLALATYAAVARWKRSGVRFFALLAAAAFVVALGDSTPVHGWLYRLLPGMTLLRASARAIYVTDFALAALAAVGAQALVDADDLSGAETLATLRRALGRYAVPAVLLLLLVSVLAVFVLQDRDAVIFRRAWIAAGASSRTLIFLGASLAILAASPLARGGSAGGAGWLAASAAIIYLDLASVGAYVDISATDPSAGFRHDGAVAFLKSDGSAYRVDVDAAAMASWQPNMGMLYGIEHVRGVANPMQLQRYCLFLDVGGDRSSPLYDLLGAKYLIMPKGVSPGDPSFAPVYGEDASVDIYLNTEALPLALILHDALSAGSRDEAQALLLQPRFDPATTAVIEGDAPELQPSQGDERLSFSERAAGTIALTAELTNPALLLVTVPYSAGWHAFVDGLPAALQPADLAFMAVSLPAGRHEVRLVYSPPYAVASCVAAVACLLALTGISIAPRWRRWWRGFVRRLRAARYGY